ncbi:MAG: PAS domain S-box protein, partial [Bacteroidales bacterium]|nr:PAS domain S-box protein [Bacteroidales bacterium]
RRKDSSEYWTDVLTIMIDFNNVNAALSVNRDITRQKETEIALKENDEKLRNIFENSTNLFYSHTPDHILTYLSPQVKDILGYTPEEAKIRWTELASENPINEKGFALTVKAIESGQAQPPYELELLHKSGRKVFVEVREAPVVENGITTSIVGAITDITDRKNVEEAIRKSEEKYRLLADNSIDVIWQMDLKLAFIYVSPSVKNMMGYTVDEWVGTRLFQHASRKDFIKMAKNALFAIKQYKEFKQIAFDAVMLRKDGTEIPVEIKGRLLLNKKGLPIGLQGTTRDITERKQAEEELKKHRERLKELVKERTAELEEKNAKLEHFNKLFVGREFRIKELRDRVKELENKISDKR